MHGRTLIRSASFPRDEATLVCHLQAIDESSKTLVGVFVDHDGGVDITGTIVVDNGLVLDGKFDLLVKLLFVSEASDLLRYCCDIVLRIIGCLGDA